MEKKLVHYVFGTYKRKEALQDWIAEELESLFGVICKEKGFELICSSILVEHVHLLIAKQVTDRNEYVMKMIKGISSRRFFQKYPSNRYVYRKLWARGYRAVAVKDERHLSNVIRYIQEQKIEGVDKRAIPLTKGGKAGNRDV
ncbi:IS200/IS605 family transposase [Candidatus Margulisiibacteriota bacterium]